MSRTDFAMIFAAMIMVFIAGCLIGKLAPRTDCVTVTTTP